MRAVFRILAPFALLLSLLAPAGAATAAPANPAESGRDQAFTVHVNDCNGDPLRVEGTLHVEYEFHWDLTALVQVDAQGEAFGSQGNEYVFNESHQERVSLFDDSFDYRATLVGQGPALDEVLLVSYELNSGVAYEIECSE